MNQLVTPKWIAQDTSRAFLSSVSDSHFTLNWTTTEARSASYWVGYEVPEIITPATSTNLPLPALAAVAAAAMLASPRKVSRRGFLGLGWKAR